MKRLLVIMAAFGFAAAAGCGGKPESGPSGVGPGTKDSDKSPYASFLAAISELKGTAEVKKDKAGHEYLEVEFHQGTDADLQQLRKALADLSIPVDLNANHNQEITDAGLAHLKGWKTLRGLGIGSLRITDAGIANLAELPALESLYIYNDNELSDACLVPIAKLTNLRELVCRSKKMTPAAYEKASGLTKLEILGLGAKPELGDTELSHISKLSQIRELRIGGDSLSDAGLALLKHFPELRDLDIHPYSSADEKVTPKGLANLAHLSKLQKLALNCTASKGDLTALKSLKELHSLTLYTFGGPKTGVLATVAELPNLKILNFGYSSFGDEVLKGLEGAKSLEVLELSGNDRLGDEGCKTIGKLTSLKRLTLGRTGVTDAGLSHLKGLTGLKELDLSNTKATPAGIAELKKSLPNLRIDI
jgi:internalin A